MRTLAAVLALSLVASSAFAGPQKLPLSFAPSLAANPAKTQGQISQAESVLPPLPSSMQTLASGAVTLWFFPETAAQLERARTSGPATTPWPTAVSACAASDGFVAPAPLLAPGASASCAAAASALTTDLEARAACREAEHPEEYVRRLPQADVSLATTSSVEGLVGIAGEAFTHAPPVPANLLPADFVPTVRAILAKVRHDALAARLGEARAALARASATLGANGACFEPSARTTLASALAAVDAELAQRLAALDALAQAGAAEAAHEALCLAARARVRPTLAFPTLTRAERRFAAFWLGGVFWRMRGGGLIPLGETQKARVMFLQRPFAQIGALTGGADGSDAAFQIFLQIFQGWSEWQDMGRSVPGEDQYDDLVSMSLRGERQVHGATDLLSQRGYDTTPLTAGGLEMGPCYFYGYDPLGAFRWADALSAPYSPFMEWPTAIGEFCSGASIALGLADTLLAGRDTGQPPAVNLCANRACGDDGCGGTCGACEPGLACADGACVPLPASATSDASAPGAAPSRGDPAAPPAGTNATAPPGAPASGCALSVMRADGSAGGALALLLALSAAGRLSLRSRRRRSPSRPDPS